MEQNIIIRIEAGEIVEKTEDTLPIPPDTLITETSNPIPQMEKSIAENQEILDEPITPIGISWQTDRWVYRIIVSALTLTIVTCISSIVWLQSQDKEIPEILTGLGTGALGTLVGLLAPTSSKH